MVISDLLRVITPGGEFNTTCVGFIAHSVFIQHQLIDSTPFITIKQIMADAMEEGTDPNPPREEKWRNSLAKEMLKDRVFKGLVDENTDADELHQSCLR